MHYVHNLETDKLNIFTGRDGWNSLPSEMRDLIKRNCLFSRGQSCWISKAKGGHVWWRDRLHAAGIEYRGTEGERLSFAEQVEAKQERAEARAERMEDRAERAESESRQLYNRAHTMAEAIPFGQPILVGHHSERRDRNYRERIHNTFSRAFETSDKAKHYEGRAAAARATADGAKFSNPAYLSARIKECETELRTIAHRMEGRYYTYSEPEPVSDEYRRRLEQWKAEVTEKLEFHQHLLGTCIEQGAKIYSRETLKGKTEVLIRRTWHPIVRLNPTTVAVPNICFPDPEHQRKWALKYPYAEVKDAR
jgi:hypothetical protein